MKDSAYEQRIRDIVLEWQQPIYNLAHRFFGNDADAADATQEIFIRVLEKLDRFDPGRPFRPWLYKVAVNVIRNEVRKRSGRSRREVRAERERGESRERQDPLERQEIEAIVQEHMGDLPEDARLLLVLHYYNGVSQSELADVLGLPRTTIQSRMRKALESVREGLGRSGHFALIPGVEGIMQGAPSLAVPQTVAASLASLPIPAGIGVSTAGVGFIAGGTIMAKQLITIAAVVGVLSLGVGFLAGKSVGGSSNAGVSENEGESRSVSWTEHEALRKEREADRDEIAKLREQLEGVVAEKEALIAAAAAVAQAAEALENGEAEEGLVSASGVDWTVFRKLLGDNIDLIAQAMRGGDGRQPTPEEEQAIMELFTQFMAISAQARKVSDAPFFDENIFPEFVEAIYADTLGLDETQLGELAALSQRIHSDALRDFDPGDSLPIEAFRTRENMIAEMLGSMSDVADPEQLERLETLGDFAQGLMQGNRDILDFGIQPDGDRDAYQSQIASNWKRAFDLDDGQVAAIAPAAATFLNGAEQILQEYGVYQEGAEPLDPARERAMRNAMLALQIQAEQSFVNLLTQEQMEALMGRVPVAMFFHHGSGTSNERRNGPGF